MATPSSQDDRELREAYGVEAQQALREFRPSRVRYGRQRVDALVWGPFSIREDEADPNTWHLLHTGTGAHLASSSSQEGLAWVAKRLRPLGIWKRQRFGHVRRGIGEVRREVSAVMATARKYDII